MEHSGERDAPRADLKLQDWMVLPASLGTGQSLPQLGVAMERRVLLPATHDTNACSVLPSHRELPAGDMGLLL